MVYCYYIAEQPLGNYAKPEEVKTMKTVSLATTEQKAIALLNSITSEVVVCFNDVLAFTMCRMLCSPTGKNLQIERSRLGCGVSRFYRR